MSGERPPMPPLPSACSTSARSPARRALQSHINRDAVDDGIGDIFGLPVVGPTLGSDRPCGLRAAAGRALPLSRDDPILQRVRDHLAVGKCGSSRRYPMLVNHPRGIQLCAARIGSLPVLSPSRCTRRTAVPTRATDSRADSRTHRAARYRPTACACAILDTPDRVSACIARDIRAQRSVIAGVQHVVRRDLRQDPPKAARHQDW